MPTLHNISDLFTKPLDKSTFLRHRDAIMPPMHIVAAHALLHGEAVQLGPKANGAGARTPFAEADYIFYLASAGVALAVAGLSSLWWFTSKTDGGGDKRVITGNGADITAYTDLADGHLVRDEFVYDDYSGAIGGYETSDEAPDGSTPKTLSAILSDSNTELHSNFNDESSDMYPDFQVDEQDYDVHT